MFNQAKPISLNQHGLFKNILSCTRLICLSPLCLPSSCKELITYPDHFDIMSKGFDSLPEEWSSCAMIDWNQMYSDQKNIVGGFFILSQNPTPKFQKTQISKSNFFCQLTLKLEKNIWDLVFSLFLCYSIFTQKWLTLRKT